jgi:hypothetical protein
VSQDSDIFSKVIDSEKRRLFKDLATSRSAIVCKGESDQIYHFITERAGPGEVIACSVPLGMPLPTGEKDLLCNFFIGGERYFIKSLPGIDKDLVVLRTDQDLFHLQRRQNYRIKIPENFSALFLISEHRNSPVKLSGYIYDLSSGGCRVELIASNPVLAVGDEVTGHICIDKKEPIELKGVIRHHKLEAFASRTSKQTFGLEYTSLTPLLEGKLFAITMDLHREFFSRLNSKL